MKNNEAIQNSEKTPLRLTTKGKVLLGATALTAAAVAGEQLLSYGIANSPTTKYQEQLQKDQDTTVTPTVDNSPKPTDVQINPAEQSVQIGTPKHEVRGAEVGDAMGKITR
jgi:hypothetical protein